MTCHLARSRERKAVFPHQGQTGGKGLSERHSAPACRAQDAREIRHGNERNEIAGNVYPVKGDDIPEQDTVGGERCGELSLRLQSHHMSTNGVKWNECGVIRRVR